MESAGDSGAGDSAAGTFPSVEKKGINRDKTKEPYYCHSEVKENGSFLAVLQYPAQFKLMLASMGLFMIAGYYYLVMANLLLFETIRHGVEKFPPLPDLLDATRIGDFTDRPQSFAGIIDGLSCVLPIGAALYLMVMGKTKRFVLFLTTLAIVYTLKSTFQVLTILPAAHPGCFHRRLMKGEGKFEMTGFHGRDEADIQEYRVPDGSAWIFYTANGLPGCNDMIFSGHTSAIVISLMSLRTTLLHQGTPGSVVFVIFGIMTAVYIYCVLAMKMHYAIDIAVALLVGVLMFTHAPLRFWIWCTMNRLVGNSPVEDGESQALIADDEKKQEATV